MNYLTDPINKLYRKLLPATIGSLLTGMLASFVDTVILSYFLGSVMLSSISIYSPVTMILNALTLLIVAGGTTLCASYVGNKDTEESNRYFTVTFICMVFLGVLLTIIGCIFETQIVALLGANEAIWQYTLDYAGTMMKFMLPMMMYSLLLFFVRFDSDPGLSFAVTLVCTLSNLIMDLVFVGPLKMGPFGAALATGVSYTLGALVGFTHFLKKKNKLKLKKGSFTFARLKRILGAGLSLSLSPFGMAIATSIFNIQIMRMAGEMYDAIFGIISYLALIALALYESVAQAAQPIMAANLGADEKKRVKESFIVGIRLVIIFCCSCMIIFFVLAPFICGLFSIQDEALMNVGTTAIRLFALSIPLTGVNIFGMYFLQACQRVIPSTTISLLSRSVLMILSLFVLTACFGIGGIWWSWLCSQSLTIFFTWWAVRRELKRRID